MSSTDFNAVTPNTASADSAVSAVSASAAAAATLIHSASQINDLSAYSSLAQVCQYGSVAGQFTQLTQDHPTAASIYGAAAAAACSVNSTGLSDVVATSVASGLPVSSVASGAITVTPPGGIASFGFTQEQVACVCEVLEQSGNIDRLAR